ncbi:MAG: SdrD B-like domain-containing protein, partial [Pirellulales bacterium]
MDALRQAPRLNRGHSSRRLGKNRSRRPQAASLRFETLESRQLLFTGGNIFVTGHDVLDHGGQRGFDTVALDFLRGVGSGFEIPKAEYSLAVIGSNNSSWSFSEGGHTKPGYERTDYYVTNQLTANPALWDQVLAHDGLIVHTVITGDLSTQGSALINANRDRIRAAIQLGMDVYAESAANLSTYYDFLPEGLVGATFPYDGASGVTITAAGQAIGLTPSMVNGDPFHNRITNLSPEMLVFDTLGENILSAGVYGTRYPRIVGRVFHDANADGVQDAGETGVIGASVRLLDEQLTVVGTDATDELGMYNLTRSIPSPGTYFVEIVAGSANLSPQDVGADDAADSDIDPATRRSEPIVIDGNPVVDEIVIDAGISGLPASPARVTVAAWQDLNVDGIRTDIAPVVADATVRLLDVNGAEVAAGVTGVDGLYTFENVVPGNYRLQFAAPPRYRLAAADQGFDDAKDSDADPATGMTELFTLLGGQHEVSRAVGLVRVYDISGFVWDDSDGDGIQQPGATGLAGITVRLHPDGAGTTSVVTDATGHYRSSGLAPGDYYVEIAPTSGSGFSPANQGGDDALDSDFDPISHQVFVALPTAAGDATLDAGLSPVRLEITEFMASNRSGLRDPSGELHDWIEITNVGSVAGNLGGWFLTDRSDNLTRQQLPSLDIAPGESVVFFALDNDFGNVTPQSIGFQLAASGEYLALFEPDGVTIASEFSPRFPQQVPDVSYGRSTTGELLYYPTPTPGAPNAGGVPTITYNLVITEFMAENHTTYQDEEGDYADWIEITNAGDLTVTLNEWHLTDDPSFLTMWEFPDVAVDPGQSIVVFASENNRRNPDRPLHTNFKLDVDGDYLALVEPDGQTVASEFEFRRQEPDVSFGLSPDLQHQRFFTTPTPGQPNQAARLVVTFSVQHGFYDTAQLVALSTETAGAEIRYTTDGSAPTAITGTVYSAPILVSETTTLRAAAFLPGESATVHTQTYIFLNDMLSQDGTGFPGGWGFQADYEMDPEIVGDPAYHADLLAGLTAIPTVSIVADLDDLFSVATGIYTMPTMTGPAWTRAASVEWIDPTGGADFQRNIGLMIEQGVGSVMPPDTSKLSLRLLFDAPHGSGPLRFDVFDSRANEFDSLLLHAGYEDSWSHPDGDARRMAQYRRDQWMRTVQAAMGQTALEGRFVHVYIDGVYWGLYGLVQPPSALSAVENVGGTAGHHDVVGPSDVVAGDRTAWNTLLGLAGTDLSSPAQYGAVQQFVDVENLADFVLLSVYAGRTASDRSGWYAVRKREAGGGFQFWGWDNEEILRSTAIGDAQIRPEQGVFGPYYLFDRLRLNADFRQLFADRVQHHFFNEGALTVEAATASLTHLDLNRPIVAESARWGDYRRDVHQSLTEPYELYTRDDHWVPEQTRLTDTFLAGRVDAVVAALRTQGLFPLIDAPQFSQHGGSIVGDFALPMMAPEGAIYYTLDGSDPRTPGGGISPTALVYDAPVPLPRTVQVMARARSGQQWSALTSAPFFSNTPVPLTVTEIMYHPGPATATEGEAGFDEDDLFEFLELKNVGSDPLALDGIRLTGGVEFAFAAGDVHDHVYRQAVTAA